MNKTVAQIICELGGTVSVANMFKIKPPSVSEWKKSGVIPEARLMYLRVVRPDLFADDAADSKDGV